MYIEYHRKTTMSSGLKNPLESMGYYHDFRPTNCIGCESGESLLLNKYQQQLSLPVDLLSGIHCTLPILTIFFSKGKQETKNPI